MATIYLHIGTPKTGSTAIQNLMWNNAAALAKHGICFPDLGFRYYDKGMMRNAHFLIAPLLEKKVIPDRENLPHDYESGLQMLESLGQKYDRIVLSDEGIWDISSKVADFWSFLKQTMEAHRLDLKLIVYLRRQDQFIQALYAQRVKRAGTCSDFPTFVKSKLDGKDRFPLDYYRQIESAARVVGKENIFIRIYEEGRYRGSEGTIFSDFLDILDVSFSDGFVLEKECYNTRLDGHYLEIKRILNHVPEFRGEKHFLVQKLKDLQAANALLPRQPVKYSYFEPQEQAAFLERFADSNRRLAEEFLGLEDGVLFRGRIDTLPAFHAQEMELLRHTILVYGLAIEELSKKVDALQKSAGNDPSPDLKQTVKKFLKKVKKR